MTNEKLIKDICEDPSPSQDETSLLHRRSFLIGSAALGAAASMGLGIDPAHANTDFQRFLNSQWPEAQKAGISKNTYIRATSGLTPDPAIGKSQANQAEFVKPIWEYIERAVSNRRITNGREKMHQYVNILDAIESVYGVQRQYVIAIWGMETSYGSYMGKKNVIRSLATLGFRGRRQKFGKQQMIAALKILERGDISPDRMNGSWAGAMGHTQFIPTTYNAYAVDFTGDGKRDIWNSIPDALASTANYLRVSKWQPGLPWGFEVRLPYGFDFAHADGKNYKEIGTWEKLGIRLVNNRGLPFRDYDAKLLMPAGAKGPIFLVTRNFRSILRYNNAVAYALSVGHLGDRIMGGAKFSTPWPEDDRQLGRSERKELQQRLAQAGYSVGPADGIIGSKTRQAVRAYQRRLGLPEDGHPSLNLLQRLR